jgi:hypothetical protein
MMTNKVVRIFGCLLTVLGIGVILGFSGAFAAYLVLKYAI